MSTAPPIHAVATLATPAQACQWLRERVHGRLCLDSRRVMPGDAFLAVPGARVDGRRYVAEAVQRGASACVLDTTGDADPAAMEATLGAVPLAQMPGLRMALGPLASLWWGEPSRQMHVTAVTGTNGKTSTTWWLAQAWAHLPDLWRRRAGVVGTLGAGVMQVDGSGGVRLDAMRETGLTTPDAIALQECLHALHQGGAGACAMEASSIGLAEWRLEGVHIDTAVLTNFTQDHLDYHGDMDRYWQAKRRLFDWPGLRVAVVHIDDARGSELAQALGARADLDVWTTSCAGPARLRARELRHTAAGLAFTAQEGAQALAVQTQVIGEHNVANLLGVVAVLRAQGVPLGDALAACARLVPVPGRLQCLMNPGLPLVAVDYAHTPDALATVLKAVRRMAHERGGRVWCVFGCGGNRDAIKRPMMGAVARQGADETLVTSDNPRDEKPEAIIAQILAGAGHDRQVRVEVNRQRAIDQAIREAAAADVVLIAGKGHEETQEIAGVKHPFSDLGAAAAALAVRRATESTEACR